MPPLWSKISGPSAACLLSVVEPLYSVRPSCRWLVMCHTAVVRTYVCSPVVSLFCQRSDVVLSGRNIVCQSVRSVVS